MAGDDLQAQMDSIHARVKLSTIVGRVVKLVAKGPDHFGLCPFHMEQSPSFTVNDDKGFYHCFGCQAHGDAVDFLMRHQGMPFGEAKRMLEQDAGLAHANLQQREADRQLLEQREREAAEVAARRRKSAQGLWFGSMAGASTPTDDYLKTRCIDFSALGHWPGALKYRGDVRHGDIGRDFPAMVSAMIGADFRSIVAVHRTFLAYRQGAWRKLDMIDTKSSEAKGKPVRHKVKMMLGSKKGAHIPVWKGRFNGPLHAIAEGTDIYVSEGIEDGGAVAMEDPDLRIVAAGDVGNIGELTVPEQAGDIVIIAQNDPEGSGGADSFEKSVTKLQRRYRGQRLVKAIFPPPHVKDFAELRELKMGAAR